MWGLTPIKTVKAKRNLIVKPGFHLKPKYDLKGLRALVRGGDRDKREIAVELPLTSMIDMFTILVIFLLMNFSATGEIFFIQKNLKLPEATYSRPLQGAPLITVTTGGVTLEAENVGDNPLTVQETDQNLPKLSSALRQIRIIEETIRPGEPFKGNINIQADEATPLVYIKRVMQTCIQEGWTGINFAVRDPESGTN
jgi:biopolymer transport protein ExbD